MSSTGPRPLTQRQQAVMDRIDRRVPIKVIARELGVSETRVNQHIRALKNIYDAENLGELVERHRAENPEERVAEDDNKIEQNEYYGLNVKTYSEPAYSKNQVPEFIKTMDEPQGNDPGKLVMSDVLPLEAQAPWLRPGEPRVVPRVLDGEHAVWFRLVAIVGIAFGFLAAVVLTVTAAVTISEALDGRATVPVNQQGFS
ncbi:helix-turn-helix transcriptional regulator [Qipengyuania sp. ASV99]|uniref:helix-turn-helix transcriptional regulator n=1 Tax=Qipengyuania sp. ASV99 TaxID=3399681 RepID=UPI003A4C7987